MTYKKVISDKLCKNDCRNYYKYTLTYCVDDVEQYVDLVLNDTFTVPHIRRIKVRTYYDGKKCIYLLGEDYNVLATIDYKGLEDLYEELLKMFPIVVNNDAEYSIT